MRKHFTIAGAILLWGIIGDAAYLMQVTADLDALAVKDPIGAKAFRAMPVWVWSAYAIAVWGSTAAAIALLLRRKIAVALFALSLAGVIVQFGWTFLATDLLAQKGLETVIFPLVIFAIGLASLLYAVRKRADGTLR